MLCFSLQLTQSSMDPLHVELSMYRVLKRFLRLRNPVTTEVEVAPCGICMAHNLFNFQIG